MRSLRESFVDSAETCQDKLQNVYQCTVELYGFDLSQTTAFRSRIFEIFIFSIEFVDTRIGINSVCFSCFEF